MATKWQAFCGYEIITRENQINADWLKFRNVLDKYYEHMIIRFSTSISNFTDRMTDRFDVQKWSWKSFRKPVVFFGLYHEGDWLRFLLHRGPRIAFWCGGDILRLQKKPFWQFLIGMVDAKHFCENEVEYNALYDMEIHANIHPVLFFDSTDKYPVTFKSSKKPHVWMTCHPGREIEYGIRDIESIADEVTDVTFHVFGSARPAIKSKNVKFYGWISPEKVDKIIRKCHAGFRGNEFDGCPHTVTKGILHGQYPISRIPYPHCDSYQTKEELIKLLKKLKTKKKPNLAGRKYWLKVLNTWPWN